MELIENSTTDNQLKKLMKEYNNMKTGFSKLEDLLSTMKVLPPEKDEDEETLSEDDECAQQVTTY